VNEDAQSDLVAVHARRLGVVRKGRQHNKRTTAHLLGEPLLADHLEEALSQLGMSCAEFEIGRL